MTKEREAETGLELVLFVADGCRPSDVMRRQVSELTAGVEIAVREIDLWESPQEAIDNRILSLPTLVLRTDGVETDRIAGVCGRRLLRRLRRRLVVAPTQDITPGGGMSGSPDYWRRPESLARCLPKS